MPHIRISERAKRLLERLARELVGAPGVRTVKHGGDERVTADEVVIAACDALDKRREEDRKCGGK